MGKLNVIRELDSLLTLCEGKVAILDALDRDTTTSDAYDLHDHITGMYLALKSIRETSQRAELVIPEHVTNIIKES
jgi:hypothetical protein